VLFYHYFILCALSLTGQYIVISSVFSLGFVSYSAFDWLLNKDFLFFFGMFNAMLFRPLLHVAWRVVRLDSSAQATRDGPPTCGFDPLANNSSPWKKESGVVRNDNAGAQTWANSLNPCSYSIYLTICMAKRFYCAVYLLLIRFVNNK
jgi:hypothetical protein